MRTQEEDPVRVLADYSVSVRLRGIDLVLEDGAHRVTEASTLDRVAAVYRTGGWPAAVRSEERRVGKECSLLCRSRGSPYH